MEPTDMPATRDPGASEGASSAPADRAAGSTGTSQAGQHSPGQAGQGAPDRHPGCGDEQRLHRLRHDRMLGGVAAGLADYFDVDPTVVRVGFAALALLGGLAVPLYLAGWALIPDEDSDLSIAEELLARERARSAY